MSLTIMEATDNLRKSGGGGNEFVINMYYDEAELKTRLDKTFAEILDAIRNGLNPVVFGGDHTDDPETYFSRYKFAWSTAYYSATDELTNCYIVFVNQEFEIYVHDWTWKPEIGDIVQYHGSSKTVTGS